MSSDTAGASGFTQIGPTGAGYAGHSLDELKLLAASIDTGRIEQMQGKFSDIARHLGEVAASLATLRNDLPNWWHGPMADATVERVAQVIDHAHSAQDTADGASKALSTCAQVVAAQQEAMKSVPEVADPNTAVQTEPLTPGEPSTARLAAMAAHQQAYSAARAEAARHVDGIAAQYVETTAQLQNVMGNFGNGFQSIDTTTTAHEAGTAPTSSTAPAQHSGTQLAPTKGEDIATEHNGGSYAQSALGSGIQRQSSRLSVNAWTASPESPTTHTPSQHRDSVNTFASDMAPAIIAGAAVIGGIALFSASHRPHAASANAQQLEPELHAVRDSASAPTRRERSEPYLHYDEAGRARFGHDTASKATDPITNRRELQGLSSSAEHGLDGAQSAAEHELYGMPSAAGIRTGSEREERGKRPNYLKEPKSTWLSDASAAPHNGILTPDWDHQ